MVTRWLAELIQQDDIEAMSDKEKTRACVLAAWWRVRQTITSGGDWLSLEEATNVWKFGIMMMQAYKVLTYLAFQRGSKRWQIKPKHHHY